MSARRIRRDRQQGARRQLKRSRRRRFALGAGAALGATALAAPVADAATYTVTTNADDAVTPPAGSLRDAIASANATDGVPDTIVFQSGVTGTITLDDSPLYVTSPMEIQGPGARMLTVSGGGQSRVFSVSSESATISGLTIADGYVVNGAGAGIDSFNSNLTLIDAVVSGNTVVDADDFALGGGISAVSSGSLTLRNTTVSDNSVEAAIPGRGGGPVYSGNGGGIYITPGIVTQISNSTISGNAASTGGGISVFNSGDVDIDISNSTIADNQAAISGGGIYRKYGIGPTRGPGGGNTNLLSTIVGDNSAPDGPDLGEQNSEEFNRFNAAFSLIENTSGATINATGPNVTGQDPLLSPLGNNGGPTDTHLPGGTSPALDKGTANGFTSDQRGLARVQDDAAIANATGGDGTDIGSVELGGTAPDQPGPGGLTVRECLGEPVTIVGTTGKDVITGTDGRDVIRGLRGNDTIKALGGDDLVCGDKGIDKIRSGDGDDTVRGGNAGDRVRGGDGNDVLRGGAGTDRLLGQDGDDQLFGGAKQGPRGGPARGTSPGNVCDGGAGTDAAEGCETVRDVP